MACEFVYLIFKLCYVFTVESFCHKYDINVQALIYFTYSLTFGARFNIFVNIVNYQQMLSTSMLLRIKIFVNFRSILYIFVNSQQVLMLLPLIYK